jgi:hypothetical protein
MLVVVLAPRSGVAQELDPGAYWPLPVGLNVLTVINNFNLPISTQADGPRSTA